MSITIVGGVYYDCRRIWGRGVCVDGALFGTSSSFGLKVVERCTIAHADVLIHQFTVELEIHAHWNRSRRSPQFKWLKR